MRFELLCQNITFKRFFEIFPLFDNKPLNLLRLSMYSEMREYGQSTLKQYSEKLLNIGRNRSKGSNNRHKRSKKGCSVLLDLKITIITICLNSSLRSLMLSVKQQLRLYKARFTIFFLFYHGKDMPTLSNLRRSI
jgi:hypothetical protein